MGSKDGVTIIDLWSIVISPMFFTYKMTYKPPPAPPLSPKIKKDKNGFLFSPPKIFLRDLVFPLHCEKSIS